MEAVVRGCQAMMKGLPTFSYLIPQGQRDLDTCCSLSGVISVSWQPLHGDSEAGSTPNSSHANGRVLVAITSEDQLPCIRVEI